MQMQAQYASIGWSVGATLGLAAATHPAGRRVVAVVGDGAFQMTAQVLDTILCSPSQLSPCLMINRDSRAQAGSHTAGRRPHVRLTRCQANIDVSLVAFRWGLNLR